MEGIGKNITVDVDESKKFKTEITRGDQRRIDYCKSIESILDKAYDSLEANKYKSTECSYLAGVLKVLLDDYKDTHDKELQLLNEICAVSGRLADAGTKGRTLEDAEVSEKLQNMQSGKK